MNLLGYVKKFGQYGFKEKPFNHVDAAICVTLSYLNFELYIPSHFGDTLTLKDIPDEIVKKLCAGEFTSFPNRKLIRLLRDSKRYQNAKITYVSSVRDKNITEQFFAMTIFLEDAEPFVSIRGTDLTLVGWKEDFMLALDDIIPSQIETFNYIDKVSKLIKGPFKMGGHSKAGNLALFAAIHCLKPVKNRLSAVYSFDGPGFKKEDIFLSEKYKQIKDKIIQVFPSDDVIGAMFYTPKHSITIKAKGLISVLQHNPYSWKIDRLGEFVRVKERNKKSLIRNRALKTWIDGLKNEDSEMLIEVIISLLGGIDSNLIEFGKHLPTRLIEHHRRRKTYSKEQRARIKELTHNLIEAYRESKRYYKKKAR
ncbi:MAG: DUF2974 domain-containing protein [Bacilli bacterium]|nr:DUF2974 domain-containing protein [Bacilli bacterium]